MTNCYTGRLGTCFDLISTANAGHCSFARSLVRSRCLFIFPVFAQKLNGPRCLLSGPGTRSLQFRMADRLFDFGHLISSDVHLFQNQINCNEATLCSTKYCKLFVPCPTFATGTVLYNCHISAARYWVKRNSVTVLDGQWAAG